MADLTQKYLDKELVDSIPEVLLPDYDEWLDKMEPTISDLDKMAKKYFISIDFGQNDSSHIITATIKDGELIIENIENRPPF